MSFSVSAYKPQEQGLIPVAETGFPSEPITPKKGSQPIIRKKISSKRCGGASQKFLYVDPPLCRFTLRDTDPHTRPQTDTENMHSHFQYRNR